MSLWQGSLSFDLLRTVFWAGGLSAAYYVFTRLVDVLPFSDDRRASLSRLRPLVGLLLLLIFSLFAAHTLFERYPDILPLALLLVLVAFFTASRNQLRDFFAGVAIRAENSCQIGDHIRVGEVSGRVIELGPRAITLETTEGDKALLPYSEASRLPLVQTRLKKGGASHTFELELPDSIPFPTASAVIEGAAFSHHWSSIARPPEVHRSSDQRIEVTVYSLTSEHVAEIEAAVRQALGKARST